MASSARYVELSRGHVSLPGGTGTPAVAHSRRTRRMLALVALAAGLFVGSYSMLHTPAEQALGHFRLSRAWRELAALDYSLDDELTIEHVSEDDHRHAERVCVVSVVDRAALDRGTPAYEEDHSEPFEAAVVAAAVRFAWALRHGSVERAQGLLTLQVSFLHCPVQHRARRARAQSIV